MAETTGSSKTRGARPGVKKVTENEPLMKTVANTVGSRYPLSLNLEIR